MEYISFKAPTVNFLYDTRRILKDDTCPVKLVIYFDKQKKRYDTKISLTEEEWEKINAPKLRDISLKEKKAGLEVLKMKAMDMLKTLGEDFTFDAFEQLFFEKEIKRTAEKQNVYDIFEAYIEKLKKEKRIGTAGSYSDAMKSLRTFALKLTFREITVPFLEDYEQFMLDNGRSVTTIGIYLRSLRTIVNIARADKIMSDEKYPFGMKSHKKYEIPRANNIKKALDETAITKIIHYEPLTDDEAKARDLWLFSFFCNGMNMADIFSLKYENIDGEFIHFHRKKTIRTRKIQEPIEIFVSKPVASIIERWGSEDRLKKNYIFGIFDEAMTAEEIHLKTHHTIRSINAYMKRIARRLGIETNITTYVARHSWATTLLRKGISTAYISKGFGHASFSTTEQYLGGFTQDQKKSVADLLTNLANG